MSKSSNRKKRPDQSSDNVAARARPILSALFSGGFDDSIEIRFKNESPQVIKRVFDQCPISQLQQLAGDSSPRSYSNLYQMIPTLLPDSAIAQLNWLAATSLGNAESIVALIEARRAFGQSLLRGDFVQAHKSLDAFTLRFGKTLWGLEAVYLLAEQEHGFKENRRCFKEHGEQDLSPVVHFLCQYLSMRAEAHVSKAEYDEECERVIPEIDDSSIEAYIRFRIHYHRYTSTDLLSRVLYYDEGLPKPDRFISLVRGIMVLLRAGSTDAHNSLSGALRCLRDTFNDGQIDTLSLIAGNPAKHISPLASQVLAVISNYTLGKYDEVVTAVTELLRSNPDLFELYELLCSATVRSKHTLSSPFADSSLADGILRAVYSIIARTRDLNTAIEELQSLSYRLDCLPIGLQLYGFCQQQLTHQHPLGMDRWALIAACVPTPRLFDVYSTPDQALAYLGRVQSLVPPNAGISLFMSTATALKSNAHFESLQELPHQRRRKYEAFIMERKQSFERAHTLYSDIERDAEGQPAELAAAYGGQYRALTQLHRLEDAGAVLARGATYNEKCISASLLSDFVERIKQNGAPQVHAELCVPIIVSLAQRIKAASITHAEVNDAVDDFLGARRIQRPSELRALSGSFDQLELVYFLKYAATMDKLENSLAYASQQEVEEERIRICQWIDELCPDLHDEMAAERMEIARLSKIRELTHTANRTRIFVDTAGIKQSLSSTTEARIVRCLQFARLEDVALNSGVRLQEKRFQVWLVGSEKPTTQFYVKVEEGFQQFKHVFLELLTVFLTSNEYGLDANLSQRIRHGTLAGEIRAPFEENHLITRQDTSGAYAPNDYWLSRLSTTEEGRSTMDIYLTALSETVDRLIAEARNKWIQITTADVPSEALFNFAFTVDELRAEYRKLRELEGVEAVLNLILEVLWHRTEEQLTKVREAISLRLSYDLHGALNECRTSVMALCDRDARAHFSAAIAACNTSVTVSLQQAADWFRIDRAARIPDFPAQALLDGVVATINRWSPDNRLVIISQIQLDCILPGRIFRPMWDLLSILLENVTKHSGMSDSPTTVSLSCVDNGLCMSVVNPCSDNIDEDRVRRKVAGINRIDQGIGSTDLSRQEGGSGYMKLAKILRHDLRCRVMSIECAFSESHTFSTSITARLPETQV